MWEGCVSMELKDRLRDVYEGVRECKRCALIETCRWQGCGLRLPLRTSVFCHSY